MPWPAWGSARRCRRFLPPWPSAIESSLALALLLALQLLGLTALRPGLGPPPLPTPPLEGGRGTEAAAPPSPAWVEATGAGAAGGAGFRPDQGERPRTLARAGRPHGSTLHERAHVRGWVADARTGQPLIGARILVGGRVQTLTTEGGFELPLPPAGGRVRIKAVHYREAEVLVPEGMDREMTVRLEPFIPRGIYLTFYGVGDREIRARTLELLERTALNALVIDVKGDRGLIAYKSEVPLAQAIGATRITTFRDVETLLPRLKAQGIYTIARIVTFKDPVLAAARPEWAIQDERSGGPWIDDEGLAWVDPFRPEVWAYVIAVAQEAAEKGFDEIQFDYVRFPTDGRIAHALYSRVPDLAGRLQAINSFLAEAAAALKPFGAFVAADVFGYTLWRTDDTGIGQRIEDIARHVDVLSPMVYPSSYHLGIPGYRYSVAHPYEIVYRSLARGRERLRDHPVRIRPWLQDFRDYAFDRRRYTPQEILAQTRAAEEAVGTDGWMLWNPRARYTVEALAPRAGDGAVSPVEETAAPAALEGRLTWLRE